MANKIFTRPKNVKEVSYNSSISKHNSENGTGYILFDPKNITSFDCYLGKIDDKPIYIKERLACMWGNEEIEEYVLLDDTQRDMFASLCSEQVAAANKQDFVKARVDDTVISYSHRAGMFSRFHYNVWFEYAGSYYYLYIKTCDGGKFKALMEEFLTYKKTL